MDGFLFRCLLCVLLIAANATAAIPVNDSFSNATVLSGSIISTNGTNAEATSETAEPGHAGSPPAKSVWWSWTAPESARFSISTEGSSFDTVLAVYTGDSFGSLSLVSSNDNRDIGTISSVIIPAVAGRIYRVAVDGKNGASGNVALNINGPVVPPPNDDFANRASLATQILGRTVGATKESGEPNHAGNPGGSSVWFTWTAAESIGTTIDLTESNFDTLLAVYTGPSLDALQLVISDDDAGDEKTSKVSFAASAGTVYQIAVDGKNGDYGNFNLNFITKKDEPTTITAQPQSQTLTEFESLLLSAQVSGLEPLSYQWQFNGTNLTGGTNALLILRNVTTNDSGSYKLLVGNSFSSTNSQDAMVTIEPDVTAPAAISARTLGYSNQVVVTFSEAITPGTATNLSHYGIDGNVALLGATPDPANPNRVILTNSPLNVGATNTLTLGGLSDLAGNRIATNSQIAIDLQFVAAVDIGEDVSGFQDEFDGADRDPNWMPAGPAGDSYLQANDVLRVSASSGDPNHLLYNLRAYDNSVQEILARIRVVQFGSGDPPRGGVALAVDPVTSEGLNFHFRNEGTNGAHTEFLDDLRSWGSELDFNWQSNRWYWVRLHHRPNPASGQADAFAKIWPADGATPEPLTWQTWDYAPSVAPRTGLAGIAGSSLDGLSEFEVDYVLIKALGLPQIKISPKTQSPPPVIVLTDPRILANGAFQVTVNGEIGRAYDLQASTNLFDWVQITRIVLSSSSEEVADTEARNFDGRFYRVVQAP